MMIQWPMIAGALTLLASEPGPAPAEPSVGRGTAVEVGSTCGGDAFSFAEVDPPRRGRSALHVVPDTLCADVEETRRSAIGTLNVVIEPPGRSGRDGEPGRPVRRGQPF
ncbi:hypothetical protein [Salinarimonas soli]|uniref:hypothetical protein n=1 Tax=Salinarimonas soli TaxID=1638099 RepID=UPI001661EF46|nr:hypothetical protein [Salinarimonas soli]